jgi:hypothetical protein
MWRVTRLMAQASHIDPFARGRGSDYPRFSSVLLVFARAEWFNFVRLAVVESAVFVYIPSPSGIAVEQPPQTRVPSSSMSAALCV